MKLEGSEADAPKLDLKGRREWRVDLLRASRRWSTVGIVTRSRHKAMLAALFVAVLASLHAQTTDDRLLELYRTRRWFELRRRSHQRLRSTSEVSSPAGSTTWPSPSGCCAR